MAVSSDGELTMAERSRELHPIERVVFFTDAVVAIAITLLILPLLEAVTDAARDKLTTAEFLSENIGPIASFALSFLIISLFWRGHDRLFARVRRQDGWLGWLNVAWMLSIAWLPVPTAMVGAMETDPLQLTLYIGSMLATSLIMAGIQLALLRNPRLLADGEPAQRSDLAPSLANSILFAFALVMALAIPGVQFWSLLALSLRGPLERLLRGRLS